VSRLVIEVSREQHHKIKTLASLQGKTIKEFVLEKLFADASSDEKKAWDELGAMLSTRVDKVKKTGTSKKSVDQLIEDAIQTRK